MTIDEINAKGGVMGRKIEPVVVDPASNWPLFAEKAAQLHHAGQGGRDLRLLDLGVAQVGAAGVRGAATACCSTPCNTRARSVEERVLHGRHAEPAGDPGRRVPDEQGGRRRQEVRTCWAPTTCSRARPTRSCAPS